MGTRFVVGIAPSISWFKTLANVDNSGYLLNNYTHIQNTSKFIQRVQSGLQCTPLSRLGR